MIWFIAGLAGLLAGIAGVKFLLDPGAMRLTVFRPWQGDPWPKGVQEDDDARFDWSAEKRRRAAIRLGWEERAAALTGDPAAVDLATEELPDGAATVEPLGPIHIHERPH